jgi:type I restriction enzyme, S subunit
MVNETKNVSLSELVTLEKRPIIVEADAEYAEIGIYCFGRGIFHKTPRSGLEVGDKQLLMLKEGDFIFQITFAWEGAVAIVSKAEDGMYCSSRFPTFRVNENTCYPKYLLNYFRTPDGLQQLVNISPGSAGRNRVLSLKRIPEVIIPLPSVEEQRRIVGRIEELAGKIAEARGLRERSIRECDNLSRSILFHCKSQSKVTPMSDLVDLRKLDVSVSPEQTYHFAGVYSFGRGLFRQVSQKGMNFSYQKLTRIKTGNFVYPKLMAWEGALGIVPSELNECVVSPEFPVFEVNEDKILPEVLDTYFRTPSVWEDLAQASTGTNARRRRLHPSNFLRIEIPVPPMEVQLRLRVLKQKVKEGNKIRQESLKELDALLPAILDKAFQGEL